METVLKITGLAWRSEARNRQTDLVGPVSKKSLSSCSDGCKLSYARSSTTRCNCLSLLMYLCILDLDLVGKGKKEGRKLS